VISVLLCLCCVLLRSLSAEARGQVERLWSTWSKSKGKGKGVCPLMVRASAGLKQGIVAHFGGSELLL
jgi:hypothetical protein